MRVDLSGTGAPPCATKKKNKKKTPRSTGAAFLLKDHFCFRVFPYFLAIPSFFFFFFFFGLHFSGCFLTKLRTVRCV